MLKIKEKKEKRHKYRFKYMLDESERKENAFLF
jgi:hypothetical protein